MDGQERLRYVPVYMVTLHAYVLPCKQFSIAFTFNLCLSNTGNLQYLL